MDGVIALLRDLSPAVFWIGLCALGALAALSCRAGFRAWHRSRTIADTPTSKVRSAAQGIAELTGRAQALPGAPIYAPLSGMPCVWWRYSVERRGRDANGGDSIWNEIESGVSEAIFNLTDETGACIVDPDGAEVTPAIRLCWSGMSERPLYAPQKTGFWRRLFSFGAYRYTECRIHENDAVYALGWFATLHDAAAASLAERARDLLAAWKRDRAGLLRRFDRDGDGEIDQEEWEEARRAAEREALAQIETPGTLDETTSVIKMPPHGQPFILSCVSQNSLIARYRLQAWAGIAGFFALGALATWAINARLG